MFCPECGKALEEGVVFCPNCRTNVGEALQEVSPVTKPIWGVETKKGFFASLFDMSFTDLITTKIIKFIYLLSLLFAGLVALVLIIVGFGNSMGAGMAALIMSPLVFLLIIIFSRILLEGIIVIFRIVEHVSEIARQKRS